MINLPSTEVVAYQVWHQFGTLIVGLFAQVGETVSRGFHRVAPSSGMPASWPRAPQSPAKITTAGTVTGGRPARSSTPPGQSTVIG
jgi:hypothetical protein